MKKKEKNVEKEVISRLQGVIGYEIEFTEDSFANKMQVSNENNFIALVMVTDMLTATITRNNLPTLKKSEKLTSAELHRHIESRNLIESLSHGLGSFLLHEVKNKKTKVKIIELPKKNIIIPGQ